MDTLFDNLQTTKRCNFCGELKVWIYDGKNKSGRSKGKDEQGRRWKGARCPSCLSDYGKEYMTQWRADNADYILEYAKQYRDDHKEEIAVWRKQYNQDHKEEISAYSKQYRIDNIDWFKEYYQRPEVKAVNRNKQAIRKFQIQNTDDGSINAESLYELRYDIQENRCVYCFDDLDQCEVQLDHVEPLSRGGEHRLYNVLYACGPCNREKNYKLPSEWIKC